jgi:predicted aldo/keto reductase-like oxidoreductase
LVERLREIAKRHNRSAGEVAIAWTLHHPAVTGAIVGARNYREQYGENQQTHSQCGHASSSMNRFELEYPIWTFVWQIVPSFRAGHNESATRAGPSEIRDLV